MLHTSRDFATASLQTTQIKIRGSTLLLSFFSMHI